MSFIKSKLQTAINNNMKNTFKTLLFISLLCGVSGADETKSVMEGDSVTLQTDENKILTYNKILWWFKGDLIAQITKGKIKDVADGRFRGRLKLDNQTGSLTITNIRTIHSGDYKIQIETNSGRIEKRFTLTVYDSSPDIDPDTTEVKSVSLTEGESVSLNTDINPLGDELIVWRFGDILIAKVDKENNKISLSPDGRFKDRIHLDQTGSLIINNSRTAHTGEYKLKISSSNRETKHKRFILYVSESPSVIDPDRGEVKSVSVIVGEPVPLNTDINPRGDELIVWWFGSILIAKDDKENNKTTPLYPVWRFKDRIHLDQTGSLIIRNSRTADTGEYKLKISSNRDTKHKRFILIVNHPPPLSAGAIAGITVAVLIVAAAAAVGVIYYRRWNSEQRQKQELERLNNKERRVTVMMGKSVPLITDDAHIKTDEVETVFMMKEKSVPLITDDAHIKKDEVNVYYGQTLIAEIRRGTITRVKDEFRERLKLDQTGSLIISNSKCTDSGLYKLKTINITGEKITYKRIIVTVSDEGISEIVMKGDRVDLFSGVTELQEDAQVVWKFADTVIPDKKQKNKKISLRQDAHEEDFRGTLKVNQQTGSLIITNIRPDQSGVYELKITSSRETVHKIFIVSVYDTSKSMPVDDGGNESDGLMMV